MSLDPRDSSRSKTYLTRGNFSGERLLKIIRGKDEVSGKAHNQTEDKGVLNMTRESSEDIGRPPESSDEEGAEHISNNDGTVDVDAKSQDTETKTAARGHKRQASPARGKRKVQRKSMLRDETRELELPYEPPTNAEEPFSSAPLPEHWSQRSSNSISLSQRRKATYSKMNRVKSTTQGEPPMKDEGNRMPSLKVPEEFEEERTKTTSWVTPADIRSPSAKRMKGSTGTSLRVEPDIAGSKKTAPKNSFQAFSIPESPGPASSSTTTGTNVSAIFELPELPAASRERSGSTSSLSSLDSIVSLEMDREQKDKLSLGAREDTAEPGVARCPVCKDRIPLTDIPPGTNLRDLNLQRQQHFCYQHRMRNADNQWQKHGYPTIDWEDLENDRIPKLVPSLRKVLQRKEPSYYLTELVNKIKAAKGSKKVIQRYLNEDIVDVAKPGYYGPRGTKVIATTLVTHLSRDLSRELKVDKTVQASGIGSYVASVLVPELTMRLVMEDMHIRDPVRARQVLADSTELGTMLHPDDDFIARDDENSD